VLNHPTGTTQRTTARPAADLTTGVMPQWRRTSSTADTEVTAARACSGVLWSSIPRAEPTRLRSRRMPKPTTDPTSQEPA
jgi:hypothetical protein